MKHILIIIVIATCLISCNHHSKHWDTLVNIESIIEERPDSALAILEQIDKTELSTDEEKACYALFLSMAHKFLKINRIVCMFSTIQNIHHRNRHYMSRHPT